MLWSSNVYLLQGEWCFIKMAQEYTSARPLGAKDALVCLQHIVCAEKYIWIPPVLMFPSIVAHDLHPQSSRFDLTVVPVLVRLLCRWWRFSIESPPLGRAALGLFASGAIVAVLMLRRGSHSTASPAEQCHTGVSLRICCGGMAHPAISCYIAGQVVRIAQGLVKTCATVRIWRGGIGGCRRVVETGWLLCVSIYGIEIRG